MMATSQKQCRRGSQLLMLAAALALVFLFAAGTADACSYPYSPCGKYCYNLSNDPNNCGKCGYVCQLSSNYKYGEVYCSGGQCHSQCKPGWKYNSSGHYCYQ